MAISPTARAPFERDPERQVAHHPEVRRGAGEERRERRLQDLDLDLSDLKLAVHGLVTDPVPDLEGPARTSGI